MLDTELNLCIQVDWIAPEGVLQDLYLRMKGRILLGRLMRRESSGRRQYSAVEMLYIQIIGAHHRGVGLGLQHIELDPEILGVGHPDDGIGVAAGG
jgi:hypothetical protein